MSRVRGGVMASHYGHNFFNRWDEQIIIIEEFPYEGDEFCHDT
jgi:hypothetical protein